LLDLVALARDGFAAGAALAVALFGYFLQVYVGYAGECGQPGAHVGELVP
jgi:hypothetical protein